MENKFDDVYVKEGMAIFIKGQMVVGIYPDNLENNLRALESGDLGIDWGYFLKRMEGGSL